MIRAISIDCASIGDWNTFHDVFAQAFGFPAFYGRNLDAWIDCMSSLDEEDMSDFNLLLDEIVLLKLENASELKRTAPEILTATLEVAGFVNWRRIERGDNPILIVSCYA